MPENQNQEPGVVRADILQRFTTRQRIQGRLNLRAAVMREPVKAYLYGLGLGLALSSSTSYTPPPPPSPGAIFDDGGMIIIFKTPSGNWSSSGTDTAPVVGPWLKLSKTVTTETVDGESNEDEAPAPITQDVVTWDIALWDDGVVDPSVVWVSETLHSDFAEDLFSFRSWLPEPDVEETPATVWLQPVEPEPAGGGGGFTINANDEMEIIVGAVTFYIPLFRR